MRIWICLDPADEGPNRGDAIVFQGPDLAAALAAQDYVNGWVRFCQGMEVTIDVSESRSQIKGS